MGTSRTAGTCGVDRGATVTAGHTGLWSPQGKKKTFWGLASMLHNLALPLAQAEKLLLLPSKAGSLIQN